ncbi:hypothetical protein N6H14_27105 [Paenibacillus sp. CC-CFT747]|nr:hypothetical protein N6H14_27105 [Paenibacillus sp. CC-CFT747]
MKACTAVVGHETEIRRTMDDKIRQLVDQVTVRWGNRQVFPSIWLS